MKRSGPTEPLANPDVSESEDAGSFQVIALPALARIKLTACATRIAPTCVT